MGSCSSTEKIREGSLPLVRFVCLLVCFAPLPGKGDFRLAHTSTFLSNEVPD